MEQHLGMSAHEVSVVPRIEQQQGHARDVAIPELQRQATLQRLPITRLGLRFDAETPANACDDRIPCSEIPSGRERDLGHESERPMQSDAEPIEQGCVCSVAQRFASWIQSDRKVHSENREHGRRLLEGDRTGQTPFDSAVLGRRQADGSCDVGAAEPSIESLLPKVQQELGVGGSTPSSSIVDHALSRTHLSMMAGRAYSIVTASGAPSVPE